MRKGEKMKELQHGIRGSAARCAQKVRYTTRNIALYPIRSGSGFWFVCTAHAIWAWKGIYRVIWPFEFISLGIAMRPHVQHLALETFPSGNKTKKDIQSDTVSFLKSFIQWKKPIQNWAKPLHQWQRQTEQNYTKQVETANIEEKAIQNEFTAIKYVWSPTLATIIL